MTHQPAIILVRPQLGENIGKAARAMLNFGLTDMRLVAPRDGWPNPDAGPSASGADIVLDQAQVFATVEEAVADCTHVFASTVRERGMAKPVVTPREAGKRMHAAIAAGTRPAILFGPERSGLTNDDVVCADTILTVPVNKDFGSLNLAQAVILCAYEFDQCRDETPDVQPAYEDGVASKDQLIGLMQHMERELAAKGYFKSEDRRDTQRRTLRNLIQSAAPSHQQVQTWRGIIKSLARPDAPDSSDT
ncbi:tRNA (cytidine/uridine-2'-O-)-methyltransferase TrmJ [Kordiimonas sediminis]|uniref:tRNA (Cytidine/uridine-2'-O-)-methyltransferase TrmJ n=1 Tax=Kordiimonas sediminis TaxID=1735581 RepID=A0A919EA44_9PROT|nr:RNA methyltransferase [Kordiimonas sediminis]GHF29206.1 tRNA (cytidine/uridine-2'-O-)-methyltransferase TrmJ [Kordiimonas sediminis]